MVTRKIAKKGKTKARAKKVLKRKASPKKKAGLKKKTARKPNAKFMAPVQPDSLLSAIVGSRPLPRTELTKKLWAYIRKNRLQDKINRRNINADENLMKVFGGRRTVNMFEMTKLVSKHVS
jgi:upstream activation factor subunit UAF30